MRLLRRLAPVAMIVCAAVLTTGCFDAVVEIHIHDDGAGYQRVELQIHPEFLEFIASFGAGLAEEFAEEGTDAPALDLEGACGEMLGADNPIAGLSDSARRSGATVESEVDTAACRTSMQVYWDAEAGETVVSEMFADDGATSLLRLPEGGWRFESTSALIAEESGDELDPAMLAELGVSAPTMRLSISLPGEPVEHNADQVSASLSGRITLSGSDDGVPGSTFTWDFDVTGPAPTIYAETAPIEESSSLVWVLPVVLAVLVVVAVLGWLIWRARRREAAGAASATDHES